MANTFSTLEALRSLCKLAHKCTASLDKLKSQIFSRQIKLTPLTIGHLPPAQSSEDKGPTEFLHPEVGNDSLSLSKGTDAFSNPPMKSRGLPKSNPNWVFTGEKRPECLAVARTCPASLKASPNPLPIESMSPQHDSQPTTSRQGQLGGANEQKHEAGSFASGDFVVPEYRNELMDVYYDSMVQKAFVELVHDISRCGNEVRKGKMRAKMMKMRVAVQELHGYRGDDDNEKFEEEHSEGKLIPLPRGSTSEPRGESSAGDTASADIENLQGLSTTNLGLFSTRNTVFIAVGVHNVSSTLGLTSMRGREVDKVEDTPDILDELAEALEWSQSQCELAADQFLRGEDCSVNIESIERKLAELQQKAEKEVEMLEIGETGKN